MEEGRIDVSRDNPQEVLTRLQNHKVVDVKIHVLAARLILDNGDAIDFNGIRRGPGTLAGLLVQIVENAADPVEPPKLPFPLVTPCCHKPLELTSLDEIAFVQLFEGDEFGGPSYGFNSRCCQDLYDRPDAVGERELLNERKIVLASSLQAAHDRLKAKHEAEWDELRDQIEDFKMAVGMPTCLTDRD